MSFIKSIILGSEGAYNLFGTKINFEKSDAPIYSFAASTLNSNYSSMKVAHFADRCLNSQSFIWITQGSAHTLAHELGHAMAAKLILGVNSEIKICSDACLGETTLPSKYDFASRWKRTFIEVAGPMSNIAFSNCKLIAAALLTNSVSWPVTLVLGSTAAIWIAGELYYAGTSALAKDHGDFGSIARRGKVPLCLASTALVSECALGLFAAYKLAM